MELLLRVIGGDPARGAVDGDGAAVREDPLRPGVAERDADADDGLGVVAADHLDDGIALLGPPPGPFGRGRPVSEVGSRRSGHQDRIDGREQAPLAQRADDPSDGCRGREFL